MHENMNKPLISIVIANYNYGRFLEAAIRSVIAQGKGSAVELIICDAASTDNSVDIIRKYAKGLPPNTAYDDWCKRDLRCSTADAPLITWWCSERDGGQSAAFNKGFSHARGEWLTWLNADDLLLPGTVRAFEQLLARKTHVEWVTGNKVNFDSKSGAIISVHWGPHCQPPFLSGRRAFDAVYGPTTFIRKVLYERMGPIDERLHYAMDTEYWARLTMAGVRQSRLNHFCWGFRIHDESKTEGNQTDSIKERRIAETSYWTQKLGYYFTPTISNVWYLIWLLWRVVDGSLLVRGYYRARFRGRLVDTIT